MAYELLPTSEDKVVTIGVQHFVEACVKGMKWKNLVTKDLKWATKIPSRLLVMVAHELILKLNKEDAIREVTQFWEQNQATLVPLIAKRMGEPVPEFYKELINTEQQDASASGQTQDKADEQMPKEQYLDPENESKTVADNLTERHNDMLTETKQRLCDILTNTITRNELEAIIQNLRTEISTESERRQKELEDWQYWTKKEIKFMTERIQNLSESTSNFNHHDDYELSPEPARAGKSHVIKRSKIWGTLDTELEYLLKKEAERKGVTFSRILDSAIWNFLKKPPLSFQKIQQDDED